MREQVHKQLSTKTTWRMSVGGVWTRTRICVKCDTEPSFQMKDTQNHKHLLQDHTSKLHSSLGSIVAAPWELRIPTVCAQFQPTHAFSLQVEPIVSNTKLHAHLLHSQAICGARMQLCNSGRTSTEPSIQQTNSSVSKFLMTPLSQTLRSTFMCCQ